MSTLLVAFLTGQSDRSHNALSPLQSRFLQALAGEGRRLCPLNFPYLESGPFRATGLLRASWNNTLLYLASGRTAFSQRHRPRVEALLSGHSKAFLMLGSCGLELFNNLGLPEELERRCTLVCYGPVARQLPRFARHTLVRGRRDFLMRVPGSHAPIPMDCGHLDYLECPEFLRLCQHQLAALGQEPGRHTAAWHSAVCQASARQASIRQESARTPAPAVGHGPQPGYAPAAAPNAHAERPVP